MRKLIRAFAMAGVMAMVGAAVLPLTSYAANTSTTVVNAIVGGECSIGGGGAGTASVPSLSINLSASTPNAAKSTDDSTNGNHIQVVCNSATWTLTEQINSGSTVNLMNGATVGFTPWSAGTDNAAADFAANTWAMKYTQVAAQAGNSVTATAWHAVPATGAPAAIANGVATSGYKVQQSFGAKTNGALGAGTYTSTILYTLTGV